MSQIEIGALKAIFEMYSARRVQIKCVRTACDQVDG